MSHALIRTLFCAARSTVCPAHTFVFQDDAQTTLRAHHCKKKQQYCTALEDEEVELSLKDSATLFRIVYTCFASNESADFSQILLYFTVQ